MQENDGRAVPRVEVADSRSIDREVAGRELGPGGEYLGFWQGGGPAAADDAEEQGDKGKKAPHARPWIQARASAVIAGCELHTPAVVSPLPATSTTWTSSISSTVGESPVTVPLRMELASVGTSPAPRSSSTARSRSEEHTSELQSQSNLVC